MLRNLEDVTKRIVEEYSPEGIILFGSAAGEGVGIGSDIDLLVIKDSPKRPMERRMEVETLLADREVALDILVYTTPEEIRRLFSIGSPFMEEIFETGRMKDFFRHAWLRPEIIISQNCMSLISSRKMSSRRPLPSAFPLTGKGKFFTISSVGTRPVISMDKTFFKGKANERVRLHGQGLFP